MADELEVCAAAFFRISGKNVVTEKEFKMSVNLNLKWMPMADADKLMKLLIARGILARSNGYLKPAHDLSSVQVPIAYRPSDDLKKILSGTVEDSPKSEPAEPPKDMFMELMDIAVQNGIQKGKFVSESNLLKKKLGVEICVAALLVLRDNGTNIEGIKDRVYTQALGK